GLYTFYTTSDDGSRLFAGEPLLKLEVIGQAVFPKPRLLAIGQTMRLEEDRQWAEVEGRLTFVSESTDGLRLELSAGSGRMHAEVADAAGLSPALLLNRRVRVAGFCHGAYTTEGN